MASSATALLFEDLCKRRFIYGPSFNIYGGFAGLFDLGPTGSAVKANIERVWRDHFIVHDNLFEISCTCLTPEIVLKASGHVDRFTDLMVASEQNPSEVYRADKLVAEECERMLNEVAKPSKAAKATKANHPTKEEISKWRHDCDTMSADELDHVLERLGTKGEKKLGKPYPFNLMFKTGLGPGSSVTPPYPAYLRPETAQGMFVNFKRLLEQNGGKLPFGAAQLGLGFRNEIAPRNGLLRVREFPMAEIEYFLDPTDKSHAGFKRLSGLEICLFDKNLQESKPDELPSKRTLKSAVDDGTINNETLAYFIGRVYMFLTQIGVDSEKLRFRQHRSNEMAHYASDCWDAEALTHYGWIEIVGIADRSCYDLTMHSKMSGIDLVAHRKLPEPVKSSVIEADINKALLGKKHRQNAPTVVSAISEMTYESKQAAMHEMSTKGHFSVSTSDGTSVEVTKEEVTFKQSVQTLHEEAFTPCVIEPAFGVGRVLYTVLEHSFVQREGARCLLALRPVVAPIKVSILPLTSQSDERFDAFVEDLRLNFSRNGVSCKVDNSSSTIGKKYARTDEIGIPFGVTIDFQSLADNSVTLRERDSMKQIRIPRDDVVNCVSQIVSGNLSWESDILSKYPLFTQQEC